MASAQVRESPEPWAACHRGYPDGEGVQGVCTGSPTPPPPASSLQMGWAQTRQLPRRPVHQPGNDQPWGLGFSSSHHPLPSKSALPST